MYKNVNKIFSDNSNDTLPYQQNCICKGYIYTFVVLRKAHTHTHT